MVRNFRICIGLLLATLVWLDVPKLNAHEWKDASGKFKVEAVFVRFVGDEVELKKSNGKLIKVPVVSPTKRAVSPTRPAWRRLCFGATERLLTPVRDDGSTTLRHAAASLRDALIELSTRICESGQTRLR
jgi:SLA1 homology domain 1, SHD1